jgi:hypothetical protein
VDALVFEVTLEDIIMAQPVNAQPPAFRQIPKMEDPDLIHEQPVPSLLPQLLLNWAPVKASEQYSEDFYRIPDVGFVI